MADTTGPATAIPEFMRFGKEQTEAMLNVRRELLQAYEDAGRAWTARVKTEVDFWSDLAKKLTASHSIQEGVDAYSQCASRRMEMVADDARRLFEDAQKIIAATTAALNGKAGRSK